MLIIQSSVNHLDPVSGAPDDTMVSPSGIRWTINLQMKDEGTPVFIHSRLIVMAISRLMCP